MIFWSCNCIYKFCKLAILQTFLSEIEEGIQNQSDFIFYGLWVKNWNFMNKHAQKKSWKFCCWYSSPGWGTAGHVSKWASSNGTE